MKPTESENQMLVRNTASITAGLTVVIVALIFLVSSCLAQKERQSTIRHHDSVEACKTVADPQQCLEVLSNPYGNVFGK